MCRSREWKTSARTRGVGSLRAAMRFIPSPSVVRATEKFSADHAVVMGTRPSRTGLTVARRDALAPMGFIAAPSCDDRSGDGLVVAPRDRMGSRATKASACDGDLMSLGSSMSRTSAPCAAPDRRSTHADVCGSGPLAHETSERGSRRRNRRPAGIILRSARVHKCAVISPPAPSPLRSPRARRLARAPPHPRKGTLAGARLDRLRAASSAFQIPSSTDPSTDPSTFRAPCGASEPPREAGGPPPRA